ncbi:MAG: hypothetical protein ACYCPO_01110 [Acidobacteriaceae bacterium]
MGDTAQRQTSASPSRERGKEELARLQQLIEETVVALTALDAPALERIRSEVQGLTAVPLTSAELAAAVSSHRVLGALLRETERNLRLFRVGPVSALQVSETGCYAFPPS